MSEENTNKPSNDEKKDQPAPLCEVLIGTAMQYSSENPMTLAEMVGHFTIGGRQVYDRAIASFRQQQENASPPAGPVGDAGNEGTEGASQDEAEDKA